MNEEKNLGEDFLFGDSRSLEEQVEACIQSPIQIIDPGSAFTYIPPVKPTLKIKKLHPDAIIPTRAHNTDAGYDLYSLEDVSIQGGHTVKIKTGIAIQPPKGYYGKISERSSLGSKGLSVRGGVCDQGYTGEYVVCITNLNTPDIFNGSDWLANPNYVYEILKGDKIAQVVFHRYGDFSIEEVEEFEETDRSDKGFGSSGS